MANEPRLSLQVQQNEDGSANLTELHERRGKYGYPDGHAIFNACFIGALAAMVDSATWNGCLDIAEKRIWNEGTL